MHVSFQALDNRHPRFNSCRLCFRRFNDESELYEHLLTHENNKDDAFSQAAENRASSKVGIEMCCCEYSICFIN